MHYGGTYAASLILQNRTVAKRQLPKKNDQLCEKAAEGQV